MRAPNLEHLGLRRHHCTISIDYENVTEKQRLLNELYSFYKEPYSDVSVETKRNVFSPNNYLQRKCIVFAIIEPTQLIFLTSRWYRSWLLWFQFDLHKFWLLFMFLFFFFDLRWRNKVRLNIILDIVLLRISYALVPW